MNLEINQKYFEGLKTKANKNRRISVKDANEVPNAVEALKPYIALFNSGDEFTTRFLDHDFDEIPILDEMKECIIPRSVRLNPSDRRTKDLIVREENVSEVGLSFLDYKQKMDDFRRFFKKDANSGVTMLSSLRIDKSYMEVVPHMAVVVENELCVRYDSEHFIPVQLVAAAKSLMEDSYFNATAELVVQHHVAELSF